MQRGISISEWVRTHAHGSRLRRRLHSVKLRGGADSNRIGDRHRCASSGNVVRQSPLPGGAVKVADPKYSILGQRKTAKGKSDALPP